MTGLIVSTLLLAPAAPVPGGAPPATQPVIPRLDPIQLTQFANLVENLANLVRDYYVRDTLSPKELLAGAVQGLYEETGLAVPAELKTAIDRASTQVDRLAVLRKRVLGSAIIRSWPARARSSPR